MDVISVVIPIYNGVQTISRTLNSVMIQSYENFEVILINDGSTDGTLELIVGLSETNEKIKVVTQENKGVSSARNRGIEEATGKYLSFLDNGDTFEVDFLSKMHAKISSEDLDYVYTGYYTLENNISKRQNIKFVKNNLIPNYLKNKTHPSTNSWILKLDYLNDNKIRFNEGQIWSEDVEFFIKVMMNSSRYSFVPDFLTCYHNDPDEGSRLSSFSMDKMDYDYESMNRISVLLNSIDNNYCKIIKDYRLNALLTFRFNIALSMDIDRNELIEYYNKYSEYINKYSYTNGLRSLKLNMTTVKIKNRFKKIGDE